MPRFIAITAESPHSLRIEIDKSGLRVWGNDDFQIPLKGTVGDVAASLTKNGLVAKVSGPETLKLPAHHLTPIGPVEVRGMVPFALMAETPDLKPPKTSGLIMIDDPENEGEFILAPLEPVKVAPLPLPQKKEPPNERAT